MFRQIALLFGLAGCFAASAVFAQEKAPVRDIAGSRDAPILKRYEGAVIVSHERKAFTDFKLPLSRLEPTDKRDTNNNLLHQPKQAKDLEGTLTRLVYIVPAGRSPLEVLRNYEAEVKAAGGEVLFSCKGDDCGGDSTRSISGGGGDSSLAMQFMYERDLKDAAFSNGACVLTAKISDQRYSALRLPVEGGDAHVAVLTYQASDDTHCKQINGRTVAMVHILEPKGREQKMVTVSAADMGRSLTTTGRISLYGIYFDTDKSEIKPESSTTLAEIAKLLAAEPKLAVLVVGHTDSTGDFARNTDLSKRRAEAVVGALTRQYRIAPQRLRAAGVGMVAPVASNDDETGRAKNRRVELVKLN